MKDKSLGLNVATFKKVHEDQHSATLMHPNGHKITVAKKSLSPKLKAQLAELPNHMDEGGAVPPSDQPTDATPETQAPPDQSIPLPSPSPILSPENSNAMAATDQASSAQPVDSSAINKSQQPQPENYPVQAPQPQQNPGQQMNMNLAQGLTHGFEMQQKGVQSQAAAQSQLAQSEAKLAEQNANNVQSLMAEHKAKYDDLNNQIQATIKDIDNKHIDANHYMNSLSSGGKVATVIGLLLGGIGAGLNGKQNMASEYLDQQINRDIDAQKAELGKKQNILSAFYHQMGNLQEATAMTRGFYADLYANQIKKAAAVAGTPMAQANAQQALGQLELQKQQALGPIAMRQAAFSGLSQGNGAALEYLPEDMKSRVVRLPDGKYSLAPTKEDAEGVRKSLTSLMSLKSEINNYKNMQSQVGVTAPFSSNNYKADSLKNSIILQLNSLHGLNRLNDNEYDAFKSMLSSPGALNQNKAAAQIAQIEKMVNDKVKAELTNHLQGYNPTPEVNANKNAPANYKKR